MIGQEELEKTNQKAPFFGRPNSALTEEGVSLWIETEENPGGRSSGSPFFDQKGRVLGVLYIATTQNGSFSDSYALASVSRNIQEVLEESAGTDCSQFIDVKSCVEREI